ncbi:MAG: hypothetical protein D6767_00455, partial [Candidatus Hydrogenedentota bacterium]
MRVKSGFADFLRLGLAGHGCSRQASRTRGHNKISLPKEIYFLFSLMIPVHDQFLQKLLERQEFAIQIVQDAMPVKYAKKVDWNTLTQLKSSFIDDDLKSHQSDVLFEVLTKNKKKIKLYILFEHKSYVDKKTLFQLLRYTLRMYEGMIGNEFVPVIPVVFYHGEKKWAVPTSFHDLFPHEYKEWLDLTLNFSYLLNDISHYPKPKITEETLVQFIYYFMSHIFETRDEAGLAKLLKDLNDFILLLQEKK